VLYDVERFLVSRATVLVTADGREVRAIVEGEIQSDERHPIQTEVKAITYHDLRVVETDDGLHARVIIDI